MKYLVAVSGGIDSVVLLDMLVRSKYVEGTSVTHEPQRERLLEFTSKNPAEGHAPPPEIIVAHFDHGIRPDSADDARFVEGLAKRYGLPFVMKREDLGLNTSEEVARKRRYAFLRSTAKKENAIIVTAHHQDDLVETIAINISRGTGWRGLAVFGSADIRRPLLKYTKQQIRMYARTHALEWVEDSTNMTDKYLRNRLRAVLHSRLSNSRRNELIELWRRQTILRQQIDDEVGLWLNETGEYQRYPLIMAERPVALELLRGMIEAKTKLSPTRPQLERALIAVKTARPGAVHDVGSGAILRFTASTFIA